METATQTTTEWIALSERLSPEGQLVMTKIDDEKGVRNKQSLVRRGALWFTGYSPDAMYVCYAPTHWKPLVPSPQETPTQHSPLPWRVEGYDIMYGVGKNYVAMPYGIGTKTAKANAELIVKCVNRDPAFQKLVEACEFALSVLIPATTIGEQKALEQLDTALRLAREGEE